MELHRLERAVLLALKADKKTSFNDLAAITGLPKSSISRATLWLTSKGYIRVEEHKKTLIGLALEGERLFKEGFPERALIKAILENDGRLTLNELLIHSKQNKEEINIALGWARKKNWLQIVHKKGEIILLVDKNPEKGPDEKLIDAISGGPIVIDTLNSSLLEGIKLLTRRPNVIKRIEKINRLASITPIGLKAAKEIVKVSDEVSQLTPELIKSGKWRSTKFRKYEIKAPVAEIWPGKKQPFLRFLDELKWKLVALGFREMKGPLVEFMFFNCDALYMPQDHPAREIHDIYFIKHPSKGDLSPYLEYLKQVKLTHENGWKTGSKGWGYSFSMEETKRLILRSQGTALSARMLLDEKLEIPGKYYSISRCYRPDVVDRTHLTEFNQIEGIVIGAKLTFRDLLGILEKLAFDIAKAEKIMFKPDYFPFTEPSVELAAYTRSLGWIEFGGAGIFRPEMTLPLKIKVPVIAWGLGINRLFMMKNNIRDIRDIFTQNLEWLRQQEMT